MARVSATTSDSRRVVYGIGPVEEVLTARRGDIAVVYIDGRRSKKKRDPAPAIGKRARAAGVSVEVTDRRALDALAGTERHQGVVAVVGEYEYTDLWDLLSDIRARPADRPALLCALDGVQDPRNLGAIIRSAHMLGADGVIVPRDRACAVTAVVTKTSAGATEHVPVCQVTNLARSLEQLKDADVWLAAVASGAGARPLAELDGRRSLCLVLGAEGAGIRRLISQICDYHVDIPMAGAGVGSLNVSVAAGIALYEVSRQRGPIAPAPRNPDNRESQTGP